MESGRPASAYREWRSAQVLDYETCGIEKTRPPGDVRAVSAAPPCAVRCRRTQSHITSAGTGSPEKIELEPALLGRADKLVADRVFQTERYGNLHHAVAAGTLTREKVYAELGDLAAGRLPGRESAAEITVADLTGVGVQDAAIAQAVVEALGL